LSYAASEDVDGISGELARWLSDLELLARFTCAPARLGGNQRLLWQAPVAYIKRLHRHSLRSHWNCFGTTPCLDTVAGAASALPWRTPGRGRPLGGDDGAHRGAMCALGRARASQLTTRPAHCGRKTLGRVLRTLANLQPCVLCGSPQGPTARAPPRTRIRKN